MSKDELILEIDETIKRNRELLHTNNHALNHARNALLSGTDYKQGVQDTVKVFKKLCEMGTENRKDLFNQESVEIIMKHFSYTTIKERIEEFEGAKSLCVGTVVVNKSEDKKAVILQFNDEVDDACTVLTSDKNVEVWYSEDFDSTDRIIDFNTEALMC